VTTLLIPGWNDDEKELKAEAGWLASVDPLMPWHVTAFHPDYKMQDTPPTPPESLIKAREIGKLAGLKYIYCGNIPSSYSDYESTSCHKCGKRLVARYGFSVTENNVVSGKCRFCKERIPGIWD
jgi:pyruvate formate lyase activating enzyme